MKKHLPLSEPTDSHDIQPQPRHLSTCGFVILTWFLGNLNVYFFMPFLPSVGKTFATSSTMLQYLIAFFFFS